jgi:eukaryotic-like serine/threonine-protein kinase
MTLAPGTKLGPYEILALVGAGGMGEVYRARDSRMGREVAVKVSAEQFSERFSREMRSIAAVNHTNVCHLYDVGPNYLVMELVEGETLKGPLTLDAALPVIRQLIDGIEAAHEKNIIHRDPKPANIKITPEGIVKILDFGLAKAAQTSSVESSGGNPENSPTLTMGATTAGTILGTAAYMAPEQARGKEADKRSDIWSFGVVVYELLTGQRPFDGESVVETLGAVINKEPDWPLLPPGVAPGAQRLLQWCLEKDRKQRLQSIGDARRMLDEAAPAAQATAPSGSRLGLALGGATAVLALALAALSFLHFREKPPVAQLVRFEIPAPSGVTSGQSFALSPDGRKLAFIATGKDSMPMVWIRSLDSREARPLAGTEGAVDQGLAWSPDSRSLAFFASGKIQKIEAAGGPAQTLCDAASPAALLWIPDNKILYGTIGPLFQVSAAGGAPAPLTALDRARQELAHAPGALLPDGRHFLYLRLSLPYEAGGIYVGSLDAKPDSRV